MSCWRTLVLHNDISTLIYAFYLDTDIRHLIFLSYCTLTVLPALSALREHTHAQTPTLQPQNPWLSHFLTLRPPHLEQSSPRHQALCYSPFLQKQTQDISLLKIFQLSNIILRPYQVCTMCVRACVPACLPACRLPACLPACLRVCVCILHIIID